MHVILIMIGICWIGGVVSSIGINKVTGQLVNPLELLLVIPGVMFICVGYIGYLLEILIKSIKR